MVCECPPEYFCGTDGQGKRLDYHQRPELSQGSVEFIAPQEYMVSKTSPQCRNPFLLSPDVSEFRFPV